MSDTASGGCLCGRVRYSYDGEIGGAGICHCVDCRRTTGSAFNISIRLDRSRFEVLSGDPTPFTKRADRGSELTRHFCPDCGSPLYTTSPAYPDAVFVKAGSLDDPALVRPALQAWTRSAVPWAWIEEDLTAFPTEPE